MSTVTVADYDALERTDPAGAVALLDWIQGVIGDTDTPVISATIHGGTVTVETAKLDDDGHVVTDGDDFATSTAEYSMASAPPAWPAGWGG
jgi:hypothetical protein